MKVRKEKASHVLDAHRGHGRFHQHFESRKTDMQSLAEAPSRVVSSLVTKRKKNPILSPETTGTAGGGVQHRWAPGPDGSGGSLGSNAKYSAAPLQVDPDTGEVLGVARTSVMARFERFALQSAARKLLPQSRTAKCLRFRQSGQAVQVIQSAEHKNCSYKGLQTCGSVWACPVCSAKISERRRIELRSAMDQHKAGGGSVLLMTLTNSHNCGDQLADLLSGQAKALNYLNTDRASRKIFASMGCIGQVKATEVTHGRLRQVNNGWHPHYHVLLFVRCGLDLEALQLSLSERWIKACGKAGLKLPSLEHGLRIDPGELAADYAAKWGLDHEMTKGHTKKSWDGETPFDLLRAYLADGEKQAGALFRQFAECFKGKRQLHWSAGLKKLFEIGDATDEELANKQDDKAILLGSLTVTQWRYVLKVEARSLILELAEQGWEAVSRFLASVPAEPPIDEYETRSPIRKRPAEASQV